MNTNIERRDCIIFGYYYPERYKYGGCVRATISYHQLEHLINEDFIELGERQNDSPSTQDFLDIIELYEDNALFEIYAVDSKRDDYRTTIEGIQITIPAEDRDGLMKMLNSFIYADELEVNTDDAYHIRAWWD